MYPQRATNFSLIFSTAFLCGLGFTLWAQTELTQVVLGFTLFTFGLTRASFGFGILRLRRGEPRRNFDLYFGPYMRLVPTVSHKISEFFGLFDKLLLPLTGLPFFTVKLASYPLDLPKLFSSLFRPPRSSLAIREA